jgi:hypothetical protein
VPSSVGFLQRMLVVERATSVREVPEWIWNMLLCDEIRCSSEVFKCLYRMVVWESGAPIISLR